MSSAWYAFDLGAAAGKFVFEQSFLVLAHGIISPVQIPVQFFSCSFKVFHGNIALGGPVGHLHVTRHMNVPVFDGGRIEEQGPPAELLDNPRKPRTRQFLSAVLDAH